VSQIAEKPLYDPLHPDFVRDPYPFYRRLRESDPLHRSPAGFWILTRHAEISTLLRDRRLRRNFDDLLTAFYGMAWHGEPVWGYPLQTVLFANPPRHGRLRAVLSKAFSAARVEGARALSAAQAQRLLDRVEGDGGMDLRSDFAYPLAIGVICDLLGLPQADAPWIAGEVECLMLSFEARPLSRGELDAANAALARLDAYFAERFAERRAAPRDDILTLLCRPETGTAALPPEALIANVVMLFTAGYETTANQICNGLIALHRHPEQLAALRGRPDGERRIDATAVEELYRYDTSAQVAARAADAEIEIAGHRIAEGEMVCLVLGAANRDPDAFPEPDRLDLARGAQGDGSGGGSGRALTFGGGPHFCLGARLSRIEAEEAFTALFERLPQLEPLDLEALRWRAGSVLRGVEALPVRW